MLKLTTLMLLLSILVQLAAAWLSVYQFRRVGKYRWAWGLISAAWVVMAAERVVPFEMAIHSGLFNFSGALTGLAVSLLLLGGMAGLRLLLIEYEQQRLRLDYLAGTDALTGMCNQKCLFEHAQEEIQRAQRSGEPLAVLVIDLDRFKLVNTRLGHAAGDRALKEVAAVLTATLRRVDVVGRLAGEEFAVLLPAADAQAAAKAAERLRLAIASVRPEGGELTLSGSLGGALIAHIPPDARPAEVFRDLLQEADMALSVAKERGQNQVAFWSPELVIQPT